MKQFSILYAIMAVMLLSAFTVNATITTVDTFDSTNPTFGSDSQQASNPQDDIVNNRNIFQTVSISLQNTDTVNTVTIDPTQTTIVYNSPFSLVDSPIEFQSNTPIVFNASETKSVAFTARISEKLDAINQFGDLIAVNVGRIDLKDNTGTAIGSFDVYIQRENNLEINSLDATIESGRKKSLEDDDTLENLKPGERIEIEAEAQNNYDSDSNLDIEDVTLEIECTNDNNLDFDDKNVDIGDISPEDEQTDTLTLDIESDAEDKDSDCLVKVIGRDQNGARHGEGTDFKIEVTRESHDIQITAATINPT